MHSSQTSGTEARGNESVSSAEEDFELFPLPLTPLERFLIRCDTRNSSMVIRVVLRFTGDCQSGILKETLKRAVRRHPLLSCRLSGYRFRPHWVAGKPEEIVTQRLSGSIFAADCGPFEKQIDLRRSGGLQIEIQFMDDGVKVIVDAHHAVTDGNGLRQVLTEWLHLYHCEINGLPSRLPDADPHRLEKRDQFPQPATAAPVTLSEAVRNTLVTIRGRTSRWMPGNSLGTKRGVAPHSFCVEHILSEAEIEQVQKRLSAWKVSLNELMIAACMSTFAKLAPSGSKGDRVTILNPTDLRLPSDRALPATNRFGFAFLRRIRSECHDPARMLKGIHDEMSYILKGYIGVEFVKGLKSASRIPGGVDFIRRLGLFIPTLQWTCLGDVTRGGKRLMTWKNGSLFSGGLKLESATGFAPFAENVPLSVASCEAGDRIALTVRASTECITPEQTSEFLRTLVCQICSIEFPHDVS
ncbi:MAG: hypothetical protein U0936_11865 [Planctomycetaceae bacterium]